MPAQSPKTVHQQGPLAIGHHFGCDAQKGLAGVGLEEELLHVRAPGQTPPGQENQHTDIGPPGRLLGIGECRRGPQANGVEVGVEGQAAPTQLEAHALGKNVVGVEVNLLKGQVINNKIGQQQRTHEYARRGVRAIGHVVMGGKRQHIELQHHRTDQVQPHFGVDVAAPELGVLGPAQEKVQPKGFTGGGIGQHGGTGIDQADDAGAGQTGPTHGVEPIPGHPAQVAQGVPEAHGGQQHQ